MSSQKEPPFTQNPTHPNPGLKSSVAFDRRPEMSIAHKRVADAEEGGPSVYLLCMCIHVCVCIYIHIRMQYVYIHIYIL